jgi:protein-S-isoprenylcysteine O-methyltransferase Ste14
LEYFFLFLCTPDIYNDTFISETSQEKSKLHKKQFIILQKLYFLLRFQTICILVNYYEVKSTVSCVTSCLEQKFWQGNHIKALIFMALQEEFNKQGLWLFRYRSVLPLIILIIGAALYVRTELYPEMFFVKSTPYLRYYEIFCLLISLFGLAIRIFTVGYTPKNTSGRNVTDQVADTLNTSGIYSIVRHPLYLGNFFMWVGPALLTGQFWFILSFCFFYWIYYERIMFAEEQYLRGKFGDTYLNWAANVPAFIPNFKNYVKPNKSFSIKKVLNKEKNGLAAVFIIFSALDVLGELFKHGNDFNYLLFGMCVFSVVLYLVLRILKKHTSLIREED